MVFYNRPAVPTPWGVLPGFLIVLDDAVDRLVKRDQQRHVAGDDLCQHTHGRADLRRAAFISEQTRQNFRANILLVLSQRAVDAPLLGSRQTMSESVLVAGWAGSAAYACHDQSSIAETMGFSV